MNNENKHYRYCFQCDKWLKKEEVNEIDWGEQPGGGSGKTWNCSHCRKQVGDDSQIQIFRCKEHPEEILKVWGVLDGENQEKVFYKTCPQEQQPTSSFWEKIPLPAKIGGGIITLLLWLVVIVKVWLSQASQQVAKAESKLKSIQKSVSKDKKVKKNQEKSKEIKPKNNQIK